MDMSSLKTSLDSNSFKKEDDMVKKQNKKESTENMENKQEEIIEQTKNVPLTHQALSMVKVGNMYSVVSIKFNPKENVVSPIIEHIESNTDMYIIQERLTVMLHDIEVLALGDYE